jgi:hypothetical protein
MYNVLTNRNIQEAKEMDPNTPLSASCVVKWRSDADDMVASELRTESRGDKGCSGASRGRFRCWCRSYECDAEDF